MQYSVLANPDIANTVAKAHQQDLLAAARRVNVSSDWTGHPGAFSELRRVLGTLMVRTGNRVAGRQTAKALVRQPAH